MTITTYYSKSAGKDLLIAELPYPQLVHTINKVSRELNGGNSELLEALRADLAKRPPPPPGSPPGPEVKLTKPQAGKQVEVSADPRGLERVGGNEPPEETVADRIRARLEKEHAQLIDDIADHELAAAKLPKVVDSDDDLAKINAWVVRARELYRMAETHRKTEKADYLQAGKAIDTFFGEIQDDVAQRAKDLEERNTPYLAAKAAAEKRRLEEQAEAKRKAAEEAAEAERVAQAAARKAADEEAAALKAIQDANGDAEREAAEQRAREAARTRQTESRAAEQAGKDVAKATKSAERDEKVAAGGGRHALGKTSGGGGSSSLKKAWKYRVTDRAALAATLGALQPFLAQQAVDDALDRAAKAPSKPIVAGVEFYSETESRTR